MGLLFTRKTYKSSKLVSILRTLMILIMSVFLILGIINDYDFFYLGLLFLFAALDSLIEAIEAYFKAENKKEYLVQFGFCAIWFFLAYQFLNY